VVRFVEFLRGVGGAGADGPGVACKRNRVGKQIVGRIHEHESHLDGDWGRNIACEIFCGHVDLIESLIQTKRARPVGRARGRERQVAVRSEQDPGNAGGVRLWIVGRARDSDQEVAGPLAAQWTGNEHRRRIGVKTSSGRDKQAEEPASLAFMLATAMR